MREEKFSYFQTQRNQFW